MDGVLLDTETIYTAVTSQVVARYGRSYDWTIKAQLMGCGGRQATQILIDLLALPASVDEILAAMKPLLDEAFTRAPAMPHAHSFTTALYEAGVPLAVATSTERDAFALKTRRHEAWFAQFRAVVRGDDPQVQRPKPAPDIFLAAADALGVPPGDCVVFEDSPAGVTGALAAGMQVVALPAPELDRARIDRAHLIVETLAALHPAELGFGVPA
jgi:pseudouridine-5'-monophosphatase